MLGALAKYIFGSMLGDVPETTSPELQYQTREVNDWLLVDMPDQAIDDEDLDSESDNDEILTSLPLLMGEETVEPLQSFEEMKDYSVCDNSCNKIHSLPSAVQHHSCDKAQGNFVDKTIYVKEDNFSDKISDITINVKEHSDNIIQDKLVTPDFDGLQKYSYDDAQKLSYDGNQLILSDVRDISKNKSNSDAIVEENSIKRNSDNIPEAQSNTMAELQPLSTEQIMKTEVNASNKKLNFPKSCNQSYLVSNKIYKKQSGTGYFFQDDFEIDDFSDEAYKAKSQKKSNVIQTNLNQAQGEFYLKNYNHGPVNSNSPPRRLYSQVVQMGRQNQVPADPMKALFSDELGRNYDRYVQVFGDKIQDSSDDEMNETSDGEMNETSDGEMNENSDVEESSHTCNDESSEKDYSSTVAQMSSDEESEEYSEECPSDIFLNEDFIKHFYSFPNSQKFNEPYQQEIVEKKLEVANKFLNDSISCMPYAKFEHVVHFKNEPEYWYAYQIQEPESFALSIKKICDTALWYPNYIRQYINDIVKEEYIKLGFYPDEENPTTNNFSLITNSADILQNIINQKSKIPTKTAVVLKQIKELKPVQQAIQFENRKYLTRSQLNRQNKNYMYQSSTKSNRRRNLQRNHSGANNNRKC